MDANFVPIAKYSVATERLCEKLLCSWLQRLLVAGKYAVIEASFKRIGVIKKHHRSWDQSRSYNVAE